MEVGGPIMEVGGPIMEVGGPGSGPISSQDPSNMDGGSILQDGGLKNMEEEGGSVGLQNTEDCQLTRLENVSLHYYQ